jgi:hypothetical protein
MKRSLYAFQCILVMIMAVLVMAFSPPAKAQNTGDFGENQIIDTIFRAQGTSLGANVFIGLSTAACSDLSVGTEVAGGSYARVSVARSLANWAGTQSAGSTTASTGTGGQTSNNITITFTTPTAGWGTVVSTFITDAASGNNIVVCTNLAVNKTINTGDTVSFSPGQLTYTIQ